MIKKVCTRCRKTFEVEPGWKNISYCIACWMDDQPRYSENQFRELQFLISQCLLKLSDVIGWLLQREVNPCHAVSPDKFLEFIRNSYRDLTKEKVKILREQETQDGN